MLSFSVVINTYNRATTIGSAIRGALSIRYPNYEVIVVNGPSTDGTAEILQKFDGRIKICTCDQVNLSVSRNVGIANASGDVVAFIDDDAVPHPSWLSKLASRYELPIIGAVGGFTIDHTGRRFQARKTLCDRFGNAYSIPTYVDERHFNFVGSPFYVSLLGTNSSFRRSALLKIGGFDEVFAYFLDETDVCLRMADEGYQVVYEPDALVFHQYAASHIRNVNRVARTYFPSAVSKSYFINRHGVQHSAADAARELQAYEDELRRSTNWFAETKTIDPIHSTNLDLDVSAGIEVGRRKAIDRAQFKAGNLEAHESVVDFRAVNQDFTPLRIALVSQGYPPFNDSGIPRWTSMMALGLAERGHDVHVITRNDDNPAIRYAEGVWIHEISASVHSSYVETLMAERRIPRGIAAWAAAVKHELDNLKSFGIDVVSCPIWDLEGIALLGSSYNLVVSLHTTYALAKPFKQEWSARPLYEHFHVSPVIAMEGLLCKNVVRLLANSQAIVEDVEHAYGIDVRGKTDVVPHGTPDPMTSSRQMIRNSRNRDRKLVVFVGRFEERKGIDIAAAAIAPLLGSRNDLEVVFVGDDPGKLMDRPSKNADYSTLLSSDRTTFLGNVSREELDDVYCKADIVLVPSRYESFGLVAIEAMAAGAVVIASAVGGLKEVIDDDVSGILVEPGDGCVARYTQAILRLLNDENNLSRLSQQARETYLKKYTVAVMAKSAEIAYGSAVEARRIGS